MSKALEPAPGGERIVSSAAAVRIVRTALDPDCALRQLAELASSDPAFALRVLAVVNSAAFQLSCPVSDVNRAVSMLGVSGMRNLALGFVVTSMVPPGEVGETLLAQALRRAIASGAVARALGERRVDEAFTVGLLLESGLMSLAGEDAELALQFVRTPAAHRPLRERASGRLPHPQAGARMMRDLGLPAELALAIEQHHEGAPPEDVTGRAVWMGEL